MMECKAKAVYAIRLIVVCRENTSFIFGGGSGLKGFPTLAADSSSPRVCNDGEEVWLPPRSKGVLASLSSRRSCFLNLCPLKLLTMTLPRISP